MINKELANFILNYEQFRNIYMNFQVDEDGIWGLPEGNRTLQLLSKDQIDEYKDFLNKAIEYYTKIVEFNNSTGNSKKLKKYKLYLKRLSNTIEKWKVESEKIILMEQEIFNNWTYDEWNDLYYLETKSNGVIVYFPDQREFIVNEGTKNEYKANFEQVSKLIS